MMAGARARQAGVGMIEVLVTLVVLALGILGAAMLHLRSQQAQMEAYQRAQALLLVNDMAARLVTNTSAAGCYTTVVSGPIGGGTDPAPCAGYGTIETRAVADEDLQQWADAIAGGREQDAGGAGTGGLIGALGCLTPDATGRSFTIAVAWQGQAATSAPAASTCAQGRYGDERQRRALERQVLLPTLFP